MPANLEREKIIAAAAYGATVFAVDGSYDDVNRLCSELAYDRPWAFVNVNMRAYYAEGSKTIALETAEQLGWRAPERVVAPIASGSLYTKILQGFEQGRAAGLIEPGPAPVMHGAQGAGCAPVASAFAAGATRRARAADGDRQVARDRRIPPTASTRSDVARRTGGSIEPPPTRRSSRASDCSPDTGIFTETAGGVTTAVLRKLAERGEIGAGETVVAYITGDGLKTIDAVAPAVETITIPADVDAVDAALGVATAT